uniref:Uncharacterized protein n=1 Tax=Lactuca sativa TaxID=4236 RepID=A0A9R1XMB7_LACSA|nr:hypothetical protein LSAT_V11C200093430 [Lactuca sativa]
MELTGRDLNFSIPHDASDFGSWRNLPTTDFEIERPPVIRSINSANGNHHQPKRLLNGSGLNLSIFSTQLSDHVINDEANGNGNGNGNAIALMLGCNSKRRKNFFPHGNDDDNSDGVHDGVLDVQVHPHEPHWLTEFSGVMRNTYGPVTAAKTIYEDEEGFLIVVSLPCADLQRVKVTWKNTFSHGIVKIF